MPADVRARPVVGAPSFEEWIRGFMARWQPGEHVALIGPTGQGKTTLAAHLLPRRKYVVALDPKGGDSTLANLAKHGFERLDKWPPPRKVYEDIANGEPARLIVGGPWRNEADEVKLKALLAKTINGVFEMGGWTLYVDELQVAADRGIMNLGKPIERNLIAARDRKVSVVSSYQRPANVPRTASDQATHLFVWYTRDDDVVKRIAEMMGRPKPEVRGAISELDRYCILHVSRDPREAMTAIYVPEA